MYRLFLFVKTLLIFGLVGYFLLFYPNQVIYGYQKSREFIFKTFGLAESQLNKVTKNSSNSQI